jgi:predicted AlkP superfamily phosphohydrolase/phosphomutase
LYPLCYNRRVVAVPNSSQRRGPGAPSQSSEHAADRPTDNHRRVLVIGLDGATWNLLDPLLTSNRLDTLTRILEKGTRASLRSCIQPSSEQAWSAFATGKQNGKFGLYGFYQRAAGSYTLEYVNASHRRSSTLWRLLSDRGKRCLVVNVPLTWPVEPVNGALVSGLMTPGLNSQFTFPHELRGELLRELGDYVIDVDIERGQADAGSLDDLVDQVRRMSELQTRATQWLMRRIPDWDLSVLVYRAPDILCHKFWRYQDPTHPLYDAREAEKWGGVIAEAYQYLDGLAGELVAAVMDERTTVVILSDHGFGSLTHAVYLNEYFAQHGLLAYREQSNPVLGSALRAGVRRLNNPLLNGLKRRAFELMPQLKGSMHYSMAYGNIDWERTRAYAVGTMGNVYLNVRGREPQGTIEPHDYEHARDQVMGEMSELVDPVSSKPIFDAVYRREEIYQGPALDMAPDVVGLIDGPYHIAAVDWRAGAKGKGPGRSERGNEKSAKAIVQQVGDELLFVSDTSGQHRMDGILAAAGAGITPNAQFTRQPMLIDLAPTILQLLGQPVPDDMDGRVLHEMLVGPRAVEYGVAPSVQTAALDGYSPQEARVIEDRLAGLGYLG